MKRLLFILLVISVAFYGCEKSDGKLDPSAVLSIRPASGVKIRSTNPDHLTALEIVQQTNNMAFFLPEIDGPSMRGFSDAQRDLNPDAPRMMMWGTDIISSNGTLNENFILSRDVVLEIYYATIDGSDRRDTIAYIPNSTLQNAYATIKPAYDSGDYETVYRVFDEAYRFIPVTGAEYAELKRQGLN